MRGSYSWAMLRLTILAVFVIPAALLGPQHSQLQSSGSWLAAVDIAEPVLALHREETDVLTLSPEVVNEIRQSAALATQAQQEAMQALRKELARELVRLRAEQSQRHAKG